MTQKPVMSRLRVSDAGAQRPAELTAAMGGRPLSVAELYTAHAAFVFRNLRRMGVPSARIEDAVQDVFLIVHRRFAELEWNAAPTTLLFGIALRVAHDYIRAQSRRRQRFDEHVDVTVAEPADPAAGPAEQLARRQARQVLHQLLGAIDADKRAVLIAVELEQMPVPAVAEALGINVNTAYTKLRAARRDFERAVDAFHRREREGST